MSSVRCKLRKIQINTAMLRIRFHRFRIQIRIHHSRLNIIPYTDPDTKIRIQAFDDQKKFTTGKKLKFVWSKIAIYLSIGLYKGRPSYRRSLQHLEREHPAPENMKFLNFLYFCGSFARWDPVPDSESGSTDLIESGSEMLIFRRRLSCKKLWEVICKEF